MIAGAVTFAFMNAGCYEHVVRSDNTDTRAVHEPNLPDEPTWIDQILWGDAASRSDRPEDAQAVRSRRKSSGHP